MLMSLSSLLRVFSLPVLIVIVASLAGCGGGSGDGATADGGTTAGATASAPASADLIEGDHHAVSFRMERGSSPSVTGLWGTLHTDGIEQLGATWSANTNGTVSGLSWVPHRYTVQGDGALSLERVVAPGTEVARGGISERGDALAFSSHAAGEAPQITLAVRKEGSFSAADLTGTYRFGAIMADSGLSAVSWFGTVRFDGAGSTSTDIQGNDGSSISPVVPLSGSYSIDAEGATTWDVDDSGALLEGGTLLGGNLIVLGGVNKVVASGTVFVLIKETTGASDATLSGSYHLVGFEVDAAGAISSIAGRATADGGGSMLVRVAVNREGSLSEMPFQTVSYSVASDGALTLSTGSTDLTGAVESDGRFAVLAGGTTVGSAMQLVFLMR